MSERVDLGELRSMLEHMVAHPFEYGVDGLLGCRNILSLVEAVEAAHVFRTDGLSMIGGGGRIERRLGALDAALSRFTFREPT